MTISVLINCYNYEAYVAEAVRSVACQNRRPDELIVVDDGSTDGSLAAAEEAVNEVGIGRVIGKRNGGQLSAFHAGIASSAGDWCCFLDADDCYKEDHLATIEEVVHERPEVDFVFADIEVIGDGTGRVHRYRGVRGDLGYSALLVLAGYGKSKVYVGGVTSALCIRRSLLDRFLPLTEIEADWRTRADDILVVGSSLAGARKYATGLATVQYRLHGSNNHADRRYSAMEFARTVGGRERMMGALLQKLPYRSTSVRELPFEYRALPEKNKFMRQNYYAAARKACCPFTEKILMIARMLRTDLFQ